MKCEKSVTQCPGYRNLDQVIFRDESERIIRKVRERESTAILTQETVAMTAGISPHSPSIPCPLSQPINELGVNFFFAKYVSNEPPFASNYRAWLTQSYIEARPNHVLRAAIEAVGMAGLSNVFYAPQVESKSKAQYCKALAAMAQALSNSAQAIADTTFMAVILFGLLEVR